jgi:hypothetical protein
MENLNVFTFLNLRLERRNKTISSRVVLPLEEEKRMPLLEEMLPMYTCKDRVKCRDFDIDKANFIKFGSKKAKIVPVNNVSKKDEGYCNMV